jgi:RimJ/RimL family protein N-acetyltransferase
MELLPIKENLNENIEFTNNPACLESLQMCIDFYKRVGFQQPWICYYAQQNGELVGNAGFKGKPIDGKVEIAYGTMEPFRQQGVATLICKTLVELAIKTDPSVIVTARTLPEHNFSTRILRKNNFQFAGTLIDPEDGEVWEWILEKGKSKNVSST